MQDDFVPFLFVCDGTYWIHMHDRYHDRDASAMHHSRLHYHFGVIVDSSF